MKRFFYVLLLFLLAMPFLPTRTAHAAIYYVDADSGNDLKPGTSVTDAWATLAKVNATTFLPGDSVLFKRGGHWSGQLAPRGSGTHGHVITLGAYGPGALPVISGGGAVDSALALSNQSYWTVENLEITNNANTSAVRSGVLVQGYNTVCAGITLRDLYVHDVRGIAAWGIDKWNNAALRFSLWQADVSKPTYFENVRVSGCTVRDVHEIAVLMLSNSNTSNTDVVISDNRIDRTGADGIVLQKVVRPRVTGNTVYHCGQLANDFQYIAGIWAMGCESPLFDRNEVAYTAVQVANGQTFYGDSQAFDIDNGCSGTPCVERNYSHDNGGGFLLVMTNSPAPKIDVRYNVSVNDGHTNCGKNTTLNLGRGGVYIYNNVFFDGVGTGIVLGDVADTHYLNNVFQSNGPCQYGVLPQYSHNCFFGSPPAASDTDKLAVDPRFVSPGSHADGFATCQGYRLKSTSPCRHRGIMIPSNGGHDFFGDAVPPNGSDIGAEATVAVSKANTGR